MIAIGLDYGTTNSLMVVYQAEMTRNNVIRVMTDSSCAHGEYYVRSPKRMLNDVHNMDVPKVMACISSCVGALCEGLRRMEVNLSDVVFTITVPNAFKDPQCSFLKAAVAASLQKEVGKPITPDVINILPEPVAAALYYAYGLYMTGERNQTKYVVVSDMGGGTTDLAVVRVEMRSKALKFKVVCTEHDAHLGGDDIDSGIMDHIRRKYSIVDVKDSVLLPLCRHLKERLSSESVVSDYLLADDADGSEIEVKMTRAELDNIIANYEYSKSKRFLRVYRTLLERLRLSLGKEIGKTGSELDNFVQDSCILLPVGGSSKIPVLRDVLKDTFKARLFELNTEDGKSDPQISRYDSVSRGAAIYSAYQAGLISCFAGGILVENRTMHKITIRYAGEKLTTCVPKSMPDGDDYVSVFRPKYLSQDGKSFTLQTLDFYQGGHDDVVDEDTQLLKSIVVEDRIYANGRRIEDIEVVLRFVISQGRLARIKVFVKNGCKDNSDFHKELHLLG